MIPARYLRVDDQILINGYVCKIVTYALHVHGVTLGVEDSRPTPIRWFTLNPDQELVVLNDSCEIPL